MISRVPRALTVLLATAVMFALGSSRASAYGLFHNRAYETVYVPSSASVLIEPTAYYVPSSFTSYYTPTVYATSTYVPSRYVLGSTAYIRPTSYYAPTRYVVRRRPVYATSAVVDTAYYLPTTTTLDLPLIRTSASVECCGDSVAVVRSRASDDCCDTRDLGGRDDYFQRAGVFVG